MYSSRQQQQQKVCPRCRFILSKTHSQKMICKRCGYTTNKLQIVAEEDTFNVNIKFSKRVTVRPDRVVQEQAKTSENSLESYMKAYQTILKRLGGGFFTKLIKDNLKQREKLNETYKKLWFGYLEKMSKQGNVIMGIFTGLMDKEGRKQELTKNKSTKPFKQQEDNDEGSSSDQDNEYAQQQKSKKKNKRGYKQQQEQEQHQQQQQLNQCANNNQTETTKKKKNQQQQLGSDKSMKMFKKIINSAIKSVKNNVGKNAAYGEMIRREILQKLMDEERKQSIDEKEQCSFSSLTYMSDRYCWMLGLCQFIQQYHSATNILNKNNKNNNNKAINQQKQQQNLPIQKRLQQKYVRQQELKQLCRERGLQYERRRLFVEMNILCYDLLLVWYYHNSNQGSNNNYIQFKSSVNIAQRENLPYSYLLDFYKQQQPQLKPHNILKQLIHTLQKMSQQVLIKQQQIAKKLPQLSLKFICALTYLSVVINQHTYTILEAVNFVSEEIYVFGEEMVNNNSEEDKAKKEILGLLIKEKNVKVKRVRKVAHQLFNYLSGYLCGIDLCLNKWCDKYSRQFNLPIKLSSQLNILTQTLTKTLIYHTLASNTISNNYLVNNFTQRFMVLQQPEIVLSCLVIYLKLVFGLDRSQYPYLVNVGEAWSYMKANRECVRDEREREMVQFVEKLLSEHKEIFNFVEDIENIGQKQQQQQPFGLLKLLHNINTSFKPIIHINQLKYISFKQQKQLSTKIHQFKTMITKKDHSSSLSLVYNLNHLSSEQSVNKSSSKPVVIKYAKKSQDQSIQKDEANNKRKTHQIFGNMKMETKISLNPNLYRAIDYLQDKYKRFHQKRRDKKIAMIEVQQQNRQEQQNTNQKIIKQKKNNNKTDEHNDIIEQKQQQQFNFQQYLDNPAAHYELVYNPTINNLQQLQLKELLIVVEKLSLYNNGEYTDCSDVLEWVGSLESVLKEFEN